MAPIPNTPELALGTVQFGLPYGVAGRGEVVPELEVRAILEDAAERGVRLLDTASAYGDIEPRLAGLCGRLPFKIVSKVPAIPERLSPAEAAAFALAAARESQSRLGSFLHALMLHQHTDLHGPRGQAVADALGAWTAAEGLLFGASCYAPAEAAELQALHGIKITQLPGNALDQRILQLPAEALGPVEVHLRSAFLQGLLIMPVEAAIQRVPEAEASLRNWHTHCRNLHLSPLNAALGAVKSFHSVRVVVVGVDRLSQWQEIAHSWQTTPSLPCPELACSLSSVTDPRQWKAPVQARKPHPPSH